jgi:Na+-translocating ferredoxin:NAD+ oxidoreductase RnfC subunit
MGDLVKLVRDAGVVGAGGAGFPTYIKLASQVQTLIINAAECEPGLSKDILLLSENGEEILRTALAVKQAIGATEVVLAIKGKHRRVIDSLKKTISALKNAEIKLFLLPDIYPIGDEFLLVETVTGKRLPAGGIPPDANALVHNVETLLNIGRAIRGEPVTDKHITVMGEVARPGAYRVPVGMSFDNITKACGGLTIEQPRLIANGLMMGLPVYGDDVVEKTTSALFVLPRNHRSASRMAFDSEQVRRQARSACEQCRLCTDLCPRYLLGYDIEPHRVMQAYCYSLFKLPTISMVFNCCECGLCEQYACPMDLSPKKVCAILKKELSEKGLKPGKKPPKRAVDSFRQDRMLPAQRLAVRLGISEYASENGRIHSIEASSVAIPLRQAYGCPSKPIVKVGDRVARGKVIAEPADDKLGLAVHSSIDGKVWKIDDRIHIAI